MNRVVAQFGSALDWGSRGRRFKSCQPDQNVQTRAFALVFLFSEVRRLEENRTRRAEGPFSHAVRLGGMRYY